ncbi:MAG: cobalamin biosynthesis protein CobW [Phycisphaera sp.]|nr:cobalamin biosynthesis protein CobW [Phycisphaera sp.]
MPGWARELEGDHTPETEEYGIGSFVYRRRRPFHPRRLVAAISTGMEGVVRSEGYLWLASRPRHCGVWAQAGASLQIDSGGLWFAAVDRAYWPDDPTTRDWVDGNWDAEVGDCRQEIVFIGVAMDRQGIEAMLDAALVTNEEMRAGPEHWLEFEDPCRPGSSHIPRGRPAEPATPQVDRSPTPASSCPRPESSSSVGA